MKISNEYVEIKIGNKVYKKQNMLLNKYLKSIFDMQINDEHNDLTINFCYLKLDTPINNVGYDTELTRDDFDVALWAEYKNNILVTDKNNIKLIYKFAGSRIIYKVNNSWEGTLDFNIFSGRKITAIGFGTTSDCLAFLDTNNMNIIINKDEKIMITRVDNIVSDGIVKGLEYPLHLINNIANKDNKTISISDNLYSETTRAILYSVGFGNTLGLMEEEYLIDDVTSSSDDYSITFDVSRTKKVGYYPSEDLQLGFYPIMDNSKYLVFKYRLYRRYYNSSINQYVINYLDDYYTMSKPNENFGNLEIKLKIERL